MDDDDDGVLDGVDSCPVGETGWSSNGSTDFDGDGCRDATEDTDDDNDGTPDGSDCAPLDGAYSVPPGDVTGLRVERATGSDVELFWDVEPSATLYDVAGGLIQELPAAGGVVDAACLADDQAGTSWLDTRGNPPSADGHYYILRALHACSGGYGPGENGTERVPASACP